MFRKLACRKNLSVASAHFEQPWPNSIVTYGMLRKRHVYHNTGGTIQVSPHLPLQHTRACLRREVLEELAGNAGLREPIQDLRLGTCQDTRRWITYSKNHFWGSQSLKRAALAHSDHAATLHDGELFDASCLI